MDTYHHWIRLPLHGFSVASILPGTSSCENRWIQTNRCYLMLAEMQTLCLLYYTIITYYIYIYIWWTNSICVLPSFSTSKNGGLRRKRWTPQRAIMWHDDLDALAPVTKKVGGRRFGDDENWHVFTKHGEIDRHQEIFIESLEFYQLNQEILGFYRFKISKYWWILELSSKGQIVPSKYDQNEHEVVPQMGFWPFNIIDSWAGFTQSRCYQNGDLSNGNGSFVLPTKNQDFRLIWFHYQKWLFYRTKYWDLMEKCGKIMFCFFKFIPSGPPWSAHLHGEVILSGVSNCISDYRRVTVCNMFMVESSSWEFSLKSSGHDVFKKLYFLRDIPGQQKKQFYFLRKSCCLTVSYSLRGLPWILLGI